MMEIILSGKIKVTPHVGVWIETCFSEESDYTTVVTPHVGVWIETVKHHKV